jgi:O-antigen ligase
MSYNSINFEEKFKNIDITEFLNNSVPVLIGILIFFNSFPHVTSIKEICFYLSAIIVVFLILFKKIKFSFRSPLIVPLGIFTGWALLSVIFAIDKKSSLTDFYSHFLRYLIFYFILINYFNSKKYIVNLSWIIIISASLFSIGGLGYYYWIQGNNITSRFALGFQETNTNLIGIMTLFAIILSVNLFSNKIHPSQRIILLLSILVLTAVTILTQTRSNLVAMGIALPVLVMRNKKLLISFLSTLLLLIIVIIFFTPFKERFNSVSYGSVWHRIALTYISIEIIRDYPIIGTGFSIDTFGIPEFIDQNKYNSRIPPKYRLPKEMFKIPHNMFLSIATRTGLIGLIAYLYVILAFFIMCLKLIKYGNDEFIKKWSLCILSAGIMFIIKGCFEPIFSHFVELILFTIFSMATILYRINYS